MKNTKIDFTNLCIISSFFILACSGNTSAPASTPLEEALVLAGNHRAELEKVLTRYQQQPADSLKYRAACFLIENMPHYTYYKGELLDRHLTYYRWLAANDHPEITPKMLADSIQHLYGTFSTDSLTRYKDIETVDSAYLCRNIDQAFRVWREQPWGKHVTFDDFCEHILPYRIGDETLCQWRDSLYRKYNPMLDSLRASAVLDNEDPAVAARVLLYCDRGEKWQSLGKQTAGADSWAYKDVPTDVLLLLRNYSRGNQERIFTYEEGKQVWK